MHGLKLGARQLWRDLRAGELRLLMVSVALAVAALTAVGFLADRMQSGLWRDARQLLGGDAVVVSDQRTPAAFAQKAQEAGLQSNTNVSFPTMARATAPAGAELASSAAASASGNSTPIPPATRLVALKAVEPGYPLRGRLEISGQSAASIPPLGEVWVDAALLEALNVQVGQMLGLGERSLRIGATITREPDRGAGFMGFAPRVMMNMADLASTGLVQPASRVSWRMAVAGSDAAVGQFLPWAQAETDKEEKGKPYRDDPLFMYLWERGYGTTNYRAPPMLRTLDPADVAHLSSFELVEEDSHVARLMLGGMGEPIKALNACTDELLTHWGIDVAAHKTRSRGVIPKSNPGAWISAGDYPIDLMRAGTQGVVHFRLDVDERGRATRCSIQQSTRPAEFDRVVCSKISRNARFEPALDSAGEPMKSYWRSTVRFELPN